MVYNLLYTMPFVSNCFIHFRTSVTLFKCYPCYITVFKSSTSVCNSSSLMPSYCLMTSPSGLIKNTYVLWTNSWPSGPPSAKTVLKVFSTDLEFHQSHIRLKNSNYLSLFDTLLHILLRLEECHSQGQY